jgi:hypothetical protein
MPVCISAMPVMPNMSDKSAMSDKSDKSDKSETPGTSEMSDRLAVCLASRHKRQLRIRTSNIQVASDKWVAGGGWSPFSHQREVFEGGS